MSIKKYYSVFLIFIVILFSACGNHSVTEDSKVKMDIENAMSFEISSSYFEDENKVVVCVDTKNNPGFLTMALKIKYDSKSLKLTDVENGKDFEDYTFIPPENKQSECAAGWFIADVPDDLTDGEILKLYFTCAEDISGGEYSITISPINDGGIVDKEKKLITVVECEDLIEIK